MRCRESALVSDKNRRRGRRVLVRYLEKSFFVDSPSISWLPYFFASPVAKKQRQNLNRDITLVSQALAIKR